MTVFELLILPFVEFGFMRRALTGAVALSLGGAPIGVFLMLRRMSLTGDAMAHAILPGAAFGFLLAGLSLFWMTLGGLVAGLTVALLAGLVSRHTRLAEDASLAGFYLCSLALGVLIISLRGSNVDLMHVLFGTVLALDDHALFLLTAIAIFTLLILVLIYRALVIECFDPTFLRPAGHLGSIIHLLFLGLVVLNLVGGFHALGTLMAVGLMMLPAAAARFWTSRLEPMLAIALLVAVMASIAGLLLSYHQGLPSGPAIILSAGAIWVVSMLLGPADGLLTRRLAWHHLEA